MSATPQPCGNTEPHSAHRYDMDRDGRGYVWSWLNCPGVGTVEPAAEPAANSFDVRLHKALKDPVYNFPTYCFESGYGFAMGDVRRALAIGGEDGVSALLTERLPADAEGPEPVSLTVEPKPVSLDVDVIAEAIRVERDFFQRHCPPDSPEAKSVTGALDSLTAHLATHLDPATYVEFFKLCGHTQMWEGAHGGMTVHDRATGVADRAR